MVPLRGEEGEGGGGEEGVLVKHTLFFHKSYATGSFGTTANKHCDCRNFRMHKHLYSGVRQLSYAPNFRTARTVPHAIVLEHEFAVLLNFVRSALSAK